jgi:peptidoglycan/LPS O-acetylase OafA/YrhL
VTHNGDLPSSSVDSPVTSDSSLPGPPPAESLQSRPIAGQTRLPTLDGLRGVAILLVLLSHLTLYSEMSATTLLDRAYQRATLAGWVGVDLFFVLSGFLITGILLDLKGNSRFFRTFYARRVLRIFPLYYAFLAIFYLVLPQLLSPGDQVRRLLTDQKWYWLYLQNLQIARDGWPVPKYLVQFWSLAVEEQFYLIWPLVVLKFGRRGLIAVCLTAMVGSLALRIVLGLTKQPLAAYMWMPARADALAVGALLAVFARQPDGLSHLRRWAPHVAWGSGLLLALIIAWKRRLHYDEFVVKTAGFTLLAVLFGTLLTIAVTTRRSSVAHRLFAAPLLVFFGRYSYGIYVLHHPLLVWISRHGLRADFLPPILGSHLPGALLFGAVGATASVGLALVSWYLLEQPFLRLKRWFAYDQTRPLPAPGHMPGGP